MDFDALCIDDLPADRFIAKEVLAIASLKAEAVASLIEAQPYIEERLKIRTPFAVLVDVNLPAPVPNSPFIDEGEEGWKFTGALVYRQTAEPLPIILILVTADLSERIRTIARLQGVLAIQKPLTVDHAIEIKRLLLTYKAPLESPQLGNNISNPNDDASVWKTTFLETCYDAVNRMIRRVTQRKNGDEGYDWTDTDVANLLKAIQKRRYNRVKAHIDILGGVHHTKQRLLLCATQLDNQEAAFIRMVVDGQTYEQMTESLGFSARYLRGGFLDRVVAQVRALLNET